MTNNKIKYKHKNKIILLNASLVIFFIFSAIFIYKLLNENNFKFLGNNVISTRISQGLNRSIFNAYSNENLLKKGNKIFLKKRFKKQKELDVNYISYKCDKLEQKNCKNQRTNLLKIVNSNIFNRKIRPIYIEFKGELIEPRAHTIGHEVTLYSGLSEAEQAKLLIHELGHVIDIFFLRQREGFDISSGFYKISWKSENIKISTPKVEDFVSGYAMTNYYEDFAESLTFYVFHNNIFLKKAKNNKSLEQKYNFIKKFIFKNNEFIGTDFTKGYIAGYVWDVTKIKIDLNLFLNNI